MIDRIERWLDDLGRTLDDAAALVARGRQEFDRDFVLPLASEAICNRVGDLAKKLVAADPVRFADPLWTLAARNRDFVVHHYQRVDDDLLWNTMVHDLPALASLVR